MEISGISSGVVATYSPANGNANNTTEITKQSQDIESQTTTQIPEAAPQPTEAQENSAQESAEGGAQQRQENGYEGSRLGSRFNATA